MSEWYIIGNPDDINLSDDGEIVDIRYDTNDFGNCYVEVPVKMLVKLLAAQQGVQTDVAYCTCQHIERPPVDKAGICFSCHQPRR